jgi:hypothetical protein
MEVYQSQLCVNVHAFISSACWGPPWTAYFSSARNVMSTVRSGIFKLLYCSHKHRRVHVYCCAKMSARLYAALATLYYSASKMNEKASHYSSWAAEVRGGLRRSKTVFENSSRTTNTMKLSADQQRCCFKPISQFLRNSARPIWFHRGVYIAEVSWMNYSVQT